MIYVYAVVDRPERSLPQLAGLEGAALRLLGYRDIAAIVSPFGAAAVTVNEDNLWHHEGVLEALMTEHTVLPLRFGTLVRDEGEVLASLGWNYEGLARDVARLSGHVEIGLRVQEMPAGNGGTEDAFRYEVDTGASGDAAFPAPSSSAPERGRGTLYLRARVAENAAVRSRARRLSEKAAGVLAALGRHAAERRVGGESSIPGRLSVAFLIRTTEVPEFLRAVEHAAGAHPNLALLCTGPWPPYSFVTSGIATRNRRQRHHV